MERIADMVESLSHDRIADMAKELIEFSATGILANGQVRQLAKDISEKHDILMTHAMEIAQKLIAQESMKRFVAVWYQA